MVVNATGHCGGNNRGLEDIGYERGLGLELASRLLGLAVLGRGRGSAVGSASSGTRCLHK